MPEKVTIYSVTLSGTWEGEADNTQEAIDKTITYFAEHLTELDYQVSTREVWLNTEEG
jgi:hypothetical protein